MNFFRTIAILTIGGTIGYVNSLDVMPEFYSQSDKLRNGLATQSASFAIASTVESAAKQLPIKQPATNPLAQALSPEQVNLRAKQITVRIDGANTGSGSIINRSGNLYTVLSNWHVMKNSGEYVVQTIDGRQHPVDPTSIKQLPGLDLAVLQFSSNQNYQLAEIGNSGRLNEGQNIYFAGYPGELRQEDNRYYRFFTANLVGILPNSTENGYSLVYNGEAFPGMSGGPVFDKNGILVGIHGEANINAITGGTSNYAIPINSYKQAIAKLETQPKTENPDPPEIADSNNSDTVAENPQPPEITVDTKPPAESTATPPETPASNEAENSNPSGISSVPTLSDSEPANSSNNPEVVNQPDNSDAVNNNSNTDDNEVVSEPNKPDIFTVPSSVASTSPPNENTPHNSAVNNPQKLTLISKATGIDYTSLRDLLKEEKWEEADRQTYKLIDQIIKTAKKENKHVFIELKTIAEFSCNDIRTIDVLWKKYSGSKFGFSPQQKVWQNVNQNGDFSTQTWRRFATEVGWKQGDVASGSGYLLYDELDFNPEQAPTGHLPWWFALPDEQQNVIKHLFARCDFNPSAPQVKPEAKKPGKSNTNRNSNSNNSESQNKPAVNQP